MANAPSNYLLHNNLHLKPISARMASCVLHTSTFFAKQVNENAWHGRLVKFLSKAILVGGTIITSSIASLEFLVTATVGGLGILLCLTIRSEVLEKYSFKILSFAVHSLSALIISIIALGKMRINSSYLTNALLDHIGHVGSAILVQYVGGQYFDRKFRGVQNEEQRLIFSLTRASDIICADLPYFAGDFARSALLDLRAPNLVPNIMGLLQNQIGRELFENRWFRNLMPRMQNIGQVVPAQNGQQEFEINRGPAHLRDYQTHLQRYVENSVIEIYRDTHLVCAFADDGIQEFEQQVQSGKNNLEMVDGASYPRIANWAQLKELEEADIQCPQNFANHGRFVQFNQRQQQIIAAKALYAALNEEEKGILKHKLLKGAEYVPPDLDINEQTRVKIHEAYLAVTALAGSLIQGALVTRIALNINAIEEGGQAVVPQNIFQNAFRNALAILNPPVGD